MSNLKCKFKLFPDRVEGLATHYLRTPGILHWMSGNKATIIVCKQALTILNASLHVGGPLTAGALRPVPHGPHS